MESFKAMMQPGFNLLSLTSHDFGAIESKQVFGLPESPVGATHRLANGVNVYRIEEPRRGDILLSSGTNMLYGVISPVLGGAMCRPYGATYLTGLRCRERAMRFFGPLDLWTFGPFQSPRFLRHHHTHNAKCCHHGEGHSQTERFGNESNHRGT